MNKISIGRRLYVLAFCFAFCFCVIAPDVLLAQQTGTISGTVLDPSGGVLPKATIVVHRPGNILSRQAASDGQGHFSIGGLPPGTYSLEVSSQGFANATRSGVTVTAGQPATVSIQLTIGNVSQQVTVTGADSDSIAAQLSPIQTPLDAESARSDFGSDYIQQFASPTSDYGTALQMSPGTFSITPNGIGLGQDKTYFRGFADGNYDITWDGIPFNDTNSPTHHSWAFFPSQWLGGIDFDRSPGNASTVGPTPFGGSINLLSKEIPEEQAVRTAVAYGSFNTLLVDGQYDSGPLFGNDKAALSLDVQRMTSDGFQTFDYQQRLAGDIKLQYKFSDKFILTGYSGWVMLDNNTPNTTTPTRTQVNTIGYNFLLTNDRTSPYYFGYNGYHLPTNFSYIGLVSDLGHGWKLDLKPYNYSYKNHQWYTNPPLTTFNSTYCATPVSGVLPCASDQLNGYHKYGEVSSVSQTSHYGVFRAGLWYEWASTHRYLYPTNPYTRSFGSLPSYREYFTTGSYQPFAEYAYQAIPHLTITGGFKYAYYNQNFNQYPDNGKTIGTPAKGAAAVYSDAGYSSWLPDAAANYRIKPNWSVYAQFAQGSIIPPSSVFDVKTQSVQTLPKPARTTAYQAGTVVKLKQVMFDADVYRIKYQNAYSSFTAPGGAATVYYLNPDSVTIGTEMETNVEIARGLSAYANGSVGQAQYTGSGVPSGLWVANTPSWTQGSGLAYQQRNLDLGIFQKAVGPMWGDNKTYHNQIPISPFNIVNLFLNYTVRNNTHFDGTKISLSFNNIFDSKNIIGTTPGASAVPTVINGAASTYFASTTASGSDLLTLTPGRSVVLSMTFGLQRKR
ncbi:MAG TPA: TonB-dependent receptor [Acidobacteriaceae bacterium]